MRRTDSVEYLQQAIALNPEAFRRLYEARGIPDSVEVTPSTLAYYYSVFGPMFIADLTNLLVPEANYAEGALPVDVQATSTGEDKKRVFDDVHQAVQDVVDLINAWKGNKVVPDTIIPGGTQPAPATTTTAEKKDNSMLIYLGLGLLVVIVLAVVLIIKKKS